MNDFIFFPVAELAELRARLQAGKTIFTTRVSSEAGKYQIGQLHDSDLGLLQVIGLQHFTHLDDHPFLSELTPEQKQEISTYLDKRGLDLVELQAVTNR